LRRATLFIFAKPPRIGLSKTRLAKTLGAAAARRIATFTLACTLRAARANGLEAVVSIAPDRLADDPATRALFGGLPMRPQGHGDLTARLTRAYRAAPNGPVMFIGADAPGLSKTLLRDGVRLLGQRDAVFGPALDGGFWLFGLHKRPGLGAPFDGVRWSGPHAMEDVWSRLPPHFRIGLLPPLLDIDDAADWHAWQRQRRKIPQHLQR
jgi:uncharacterized protein